MTGLDSDEDTILSIACYITDSQLNLLEPDGFETIIHHDQAALDRMGAWCTTTHAASGLTAAALASTTTPAQAARDLLAYIQMHVRRPRSALLAGNTVHADKAFLRREPYAPVIQYLHHRILDVSAIKEAARRWSGDEVLEGSPRKQGLHDARADILESLEEARYYRRVIFGCADDALEYTAPQR